MSEFVRTVVNPESVKVWKKRQDWYTVVDKGLPLRLDAGTNIPLSLICATKSETKHQRCELLKVFFLIRSHPCMVLCTNALQ